MIGVSFLKNTTEASRYPTILVPYWDCTKMVMSNPHYASGLIKKLSTAAVRTVFVYCLCPVNLGHLEQDNNMCFTEIFFYFFCEETILFFGFLIWDIICNRHCNQSWKSRDELLSAYYLYTFSGHKKSINKQDNWTEKKSMTNRDNWTE